MLPAQTVQALAQNLEEPGVTVDDGDPKGANARRWHHPVIVGRGGGTFRHDGIESRHIAPRMWPDRPAGHRLFTTSDRPDHFEPGACDESENSRKSPLTTNATCSPTSTALSPTRSNARATITIVIAHSRVSG